MGGLFSIVRLRLMVQSDFFAFTASMNKVVLKMEAYTNPLRFPQVEVSLYWLVFFLTIFAFIVT